MVDRDLPTNSVVEPAEGDARMVEGWDGVELQRQFLALRRAGALPPQARLERRSLSSCALLTHRELSFVFSLGASLPPFLPNQVTLQLHFRCSHELRTLSETFHIKLVICRRCKLQYKMQQC